jgi:hypothetical protein
MKKELMPIIRLQGKILRPSPAFGGRQSVGISMDLHGLEVISDRRRDDPFVYEFLSARDKGIEDVLPEFGKHAVFHTIGTCGTRKKDFAKAGSGFDFAIEPRP